ncbi:MAG: UDP-glucose/GDP-mannose dehydrogenase family protein, partial [Alphaproteobacteria bacterium]
FKPETDDMRDSPSLDLIESLTASGAHIRAYDPKAMEEAKASLPDTVTYCDSAKACLTAADVAVIVTEWNEFRALTPQIFIDEMKGSALVDLRNVYEPEVMAAAGLTYVSIGRSCLERES